VREFSESPDRTPETGETGSGDTAYALVGLSLPAFAVSARRGWRVVRGYGNDKSIASRRRRFLVAVRVGGPPVDRRSCPGRQSAVVAGAGHARAVDVRRSAGGPGCTAHGGPRRLRHHAPADGRAAPHGSRPGGSGRPHLRSERRGGRLRPRAAAGCVDGDEQGEGSSSRGRIPAAHHDSQAGVLLLAHRRRSPARAGGRQLHRAVLLGGARHHAAGCDVSARLCAVRPAGGRGGGVRPGDVRSILVAGPHLSDGHAARPHDDGRVPLLVRRRPHQPQRGSSRLLPDGVSPAGRRHASPTCSWPG